MRCTTPAAVSTVWLVKINHAAARRSVGVSIEAAVNRAKWAACAVVGSGPAGLEIKGGK